ncbi:MATE family efflux transporter [Sulfitobacter sp. M57]|uniref:MATE family efflux transporter n=1 Tax=unclassified Sulfitobacter TaxID=196795 RepID=UPI0023E1E5AE|nr:MULTISPECIES: MATE family efflux transporter [unclassified Sulfitobacter]MDF3519857.1 MATE family efflux transporter [Sulfitobacter sp. M74]MDF3543286.1 MATE family efflux transporter [Sulfitobacter sp. M72]MDF3413423.1 MATE family efflux transporter [Sulfitobacter sp. KE5]MDF3421297.1 MATE family efflux transporter [Sulfitobacter sp. KE43]MDF3431970.1 MATE family efflux transporter [Sulfitobacter sp. KE42]
MSHPNSFTHGPLGQIFAKTALPIIFVMGMNGLLTVVDAIFLGRYVGAEALSAVTLIFPFYMLIVALATLVSGGMSSILARQLGAADMAGARATFAGAHGFALFVSAALILGYLLFGRTLSLALASGSEPLADMAQTYLAITAFVSPLAFLLSVHSDALRNEGRVGFMAAMSLLVSISNIGFNYVLIAMMGLGVAGSAIGTALAQLLAFAIILTYRLTDHAELHPRVVMQTSLTQGWSRILALGAPQSLNFIGIALGSAAVITALQMFEVLNYANTVSAFGIVTRVMTFLFLPLLGLTFALQSIVGNNYGAQEWQRSDQSLRLGIWIAFIYCSFFQVILMVFPETIAKAFVDDPAVIAAFAHIISFTVAMLWLAGPLIVIASYFQAIGNASRAAILGLSKPYAFALPLTFALPAIWGEPGIWMAGPLAEILMALLTIAVLHQASTALNLRRGLFTAAASR